MAIQLLLSSYMLVEELKSAPSLAELEFSTRIIYKSVVCIIDR
jgi:hypothetical protein